MIYNRLICTTTSMTREIFSVNEEYASYPVSVLIKEENGKYYLFSNEDINGFWYDYLNGFYYLKDI